MVLCLKTSFLPFMGQVFDRIDAIKVLHSTPKNFSKPHFRGRCDATACIVHSQNAAVIDRCNERKWAG
jgi:hypothetical protein